MEEEAPKENLTIAELRTASDKKDFDRILSDLKKAFSMDFTNEEACHYAGINPDTYYSWCKRSERFKKKMERAKSKLFRMAKMNIAESIKTKKDSDLSFKLLERRQKDLYANRSELTGAGGEELNTGQDELRRIADATTKLLDQKEENEPVGTPTTTSEGNN